MIGLTTAQADCARVIGELTQVLGRRPSYSEIAREMSVGKSNVFRLIQGLGTRGWLKREQVRFVTELTSPPPSASPETAITLTAAGREALLMTLPAEAGRHD